MSWLVLLALAGPPGCARLKSGASGETKLGLEQTPPAVRQTIERELAGAQLEDIALKEQAGKRVYETDIIRQGHKWEVIVDEGGNVLAKTQEGGEKNGARQEGEPGGGEWRVRFDVHKADLAPTGKNPYLPIQPGRVLQLAHGNERLTVSILPGTKTVDGVTTGVLEEREEKDGQLVEISRNYLASDPRTGDVYYFGEDVDNYQEGKVIHHESAWLSGRKRARFGLMMPGKPEKGQKFYQEMAPKVALDRVEVVSTDETVKTPAGTFEHCVHLQETTPLEPGTSHKYYAPGVGMIKDDEFELTEKN